MINTGVTLQNENILLRPTVESDFELLATLAKDKSMWVYFTHDLSDKNDFETWFNDALKGKEAKTRLPFTVILKENNMVTGATSFGNFSVRDKRIEIGWTWFGPQFWGKGINTQAKYLMLKYCFEVLELERVELKTDVLNVPARNALLRMNITEEGVLRSHTLMTKGRRRDTIYYSVLKNEWQELKLKNNRE
ncbi:MAG TPA: GNAT family protein [Draconibacterium sp.]|nr:GNAT family protein [Draconibacterium sp.]